MADVRRSVLPSLQEAASITFMRATPPPETTWSELGADSLDVVELSYHLEDIEGVLFEAADLEVGDTIAATAAHLDRKLQEMRR